MYFVLVLSEFLKYGGINPLTGKFDEEVSEKTYIFFSSSQLAKNIDDSKNYAIKNISMNEAEKFIQASAFAQNLIVRTSAKPPQLRYSS